MKERVKILGIDDGHFVKHKSKKALLIGAVLRAGYLEGVLSTNVAVDGFDSTKKIIEMINRTGHKKQLKAVMIHGFTVGGFNIIDVRRVAEKTKLPIVCVLRKKPRAAAVESALRNLQGSVKRIALFRKGPEFKKHHGIFYSSTGLDDHAATELLEKTTVRGNIPEPIRVAHLIASGVSHDKSTKP